MDKTRNMLGYMRNMYKILVAKLEEKRLFGIYRCRCENVWSGFVRLGILSSVVLVTNV